MEKLYMVTLLLEAAEFARLLLPAKRNSCPF